MRIIFFASVYPPDLGAGSFRAKSIATALSEHISENDWVHVVTTQPSRYSNHRVVAPKMEKNGNVIVYRARMPTHQNGFFSGTICFIAYALQAAIYCFRSKPDYILGTSSRLMTALLTAVVAFLFRCKYYIDLRDIFSEVMPALFNNKNRLVSKIIGEILVFIEKRVLVNAVGVNLVSKGFTDYFESHNISTTEWSYFPNGVDSEFVLRRVNERIDSGKATTILYAGNIGSGQGLETILPELSIRLGEKYRIHVIGDGASRHLLEDKIQRVGATNLELSLPVQRDRLVDLYERADILLLHLNDMSAFERVLPSKLFEYAALGKPIVAGIRGYAAEFVRANIPYGIIFHPGDIDAAVEAIYAANGFRVNQTDVDRFIEEFSREKIMGKMARDIISRIPE